MGFLCRGGRQFNYQRCDGQVDVSRSSCIAVSIAVYTNVFGLCFSCSAIAACVFRISISISSRRLKVSTVDFATPAAVRLG